jgi:membrane-bound serine protease (ClpP class)
MVALVGAVLVGKYLPHIPGANLLMKMPTRDEAAGPDELGPETERLRQLLGAVGVAATSLRPAGMARFGDDYVDVVADGAYVAAGARVQVIEIESNRVVVKEV